MKVSRICPVSAEVPPVVGGTSLAPAARHGLNGS